jgi:hypothetical protein
MYTHFYPIMVGVDALLKFCYFLNDTGYLVLGFLGVFVLFRSFARALLILKK